MPLAIVLALVFALSAVVMVGWTVAYHSSRCRPYRLVLSTRGPTGTKLYRRVAGNMLLSAVFMVAATYGLYPLLFTEDPSPWWQTSLKVVAILLLYDFCYYLLHRFAFHGWKPLRAVHAVHHAVRHPSAPESLYMHPVENLMGLSLLLLCTIVWGPVTTGAFGWLFAIHSTFNIIVHCGLDIPLLGLRPFGYLARKHDIHHTSMKAGNYASLTPFWDRLFGTAT